MNNKNKVGPNVEPCGTLVRIREKEDTLVPLSIVC